MRARGAAFASAVALLLAACDPVPPANDPFAKLEGNVTEVPNGRFDYDYKVVYDWGANPERHFHVIVDHRCEMLHRTGTSNPIISRMHLAEFWPLDERGMLPTGMVDNINRRVNANTAYAEAHECCEYKILGIQRTSGAGTIPGGPTSIALGPQTAAGVPVRELSTIVWFRGGNGSTATANENQNHYAKFRQNKGVLPGSFTYKATTPPREGGFRTEYSLNAEGFKMENVSGGQNKGDQRPLTGCDFPLP